MITASCFKSKKYFYFATGRMNTINCIGLNLTEYFSFFNYNYMK
jgi:hypothetical protein